MLNIKYIVLYLFFTFHIEKLNANSHFLHKTINIVNSQNNNYFLKSIPFDRNDESSFGTTSIYNSDSNLLYQIDRYFELFDNRLEAFISNDGETVAYVKDMEFYGDIDKINCIEIFKKGISVKKFLLKDLINCNSDFEDCYLFYKEAIDTVYWKKGILNTIYKDSATDFEKQLTKKATYLNNDTLYIFTKTSQIISLDLNTLNFNSIPITKINKSYFKDIKPLFLDKKRIYSPYISGLPKLSNGSSLEKEFAELFNKDIYPENSDISNLYKRHSFKLEIIVDKSGNAVVNKIDNYSNLSEDSIKYFIKLQNFEVNDIPTDIDKWKFSGWIDLINKSREEAKKERQLEIIQQKEEYERNIIADSIHGIYIPKNLEDSFYELNKILKPKEVKGLKNLKDRTETLKYHHGLGMWLRNNWSLWGGSRLQQYFINKGIEHPDEMSGIVLEFYYDWLNGQNEKWRVFDNK